MERLNHRAPLGYVTYVYMYIYTYIYTYSSICAVNEDEGNCEVWEVREGIATRRETIREIAVGQGRDAQGGRCLPAVLGIFVHGSRPLESRGMARKGRGRQGEREAEARCRGREVEIARREATDVRVNAITLHLCSKLS